MTFDPLSYKVPGEFVYKGVIYGEPYMTPANLSKVEDWDPHPTDIIIASYPKTGEY